MMDELANEIIEDCFWEYDFTGNDIYQMAKSSDMERKKFLFSKILENSTNLIKSMKIFGKNDLRSLVESYKIPSFNQEFLKRRINILEYYFLDKPLKITELQWVA